MAKNLYTAESLAGIEGRLKRRFALLAVACVLLAALAVWSACVHPAIEWLTMVSVLLAGFIAIFVIDLFCLPLIRYRRLVREALTGRTHTQTLEFVRAESDISMVDGVACRGLIFLGDPDKHGSRDMLLYWDREIPLPELEPGAFYAVQYTGKTIIALDRADPSSRP